MKNIIHFFRSAPRPVQLVAFVWIFAVSVLIYRNLATDASVQSFSDWTETISTNADEWQAFEDHTVQRADNDKRYANRPEKKEDDQADDNNNRQVDEDKGESGFFNNVFNSFVNWLVDKAVNSSSMSNRQISSVDSHKAPAPTAIITDTVKTV